MSSDELRLRVIAPILALGLRLEDERELAAATLAQLDAAAHDRFRRSVARKKFAPLYASIFELLENRSALVAVDADALPDALLVRLAELKEGTDPAVVAAEDPHVAALCDRLRRLETILEREEKGIEDAGDHAYQLVIRFTEPFRIDDLGCEDLGDLEDWIADALGNPDDDPQATHVVDGNAYGGGTVEIFVDTNDPHDALLRLRRRLHGRDAAQHLVAAFRNFESDVYTVIWPEGFEGTFDPA